MRLLVSAPQLFGWEDVNLPRLAQDEVWVRTLYSAVSISSELSVVEGIPGLTYPCKLGYQTLGVVEEKGDQVALRTGQRVLSTLGHASAGIHRATQLIPVPDQISDRIALCAILGEETHKGIRKITPQPQERVLVAGAGLLGLLTVFNLIRRGIKGITVLEPEAQRRELAVSFGATAYAPGNLPHDQFDIGFECSASPAGFAELLSHLRSGGRCCVLSDGNWGRLSLPAEFHQRELSVTASSDGEDYHAYATWLWANADPVLEQLFQHQIRPEELPATFARLRNLPRPVSMLVKW